jgi:tripartite-type tricarboxylate transporter receptor subunit TctC
MKTNYPAAVVFLSAAVALLTALSPICIQAQTYPSKPVRIVVPFAAGGAVDTVGRLVSLKLSESWRSPVIVENRPGAGGLIAAEQVARSVPDGHTLLLGSVALAVTPSTYRKLPYDPEKDLVPLTQITAHALVLAVNGKLPAANVKELVAVSKLKPGSLSYGTTGAGTSTHLLIELVNLTAGTDFLHVPYKGDAPAVAALLSGEIQLSLMPAIGIINHLQSGRLRALGVTGPKRTFILPDVPTMSENGVAGFETASWTGIFSPAGLTREVQQRFQGEVVKVLALPEVREQLAKHGFEPVGSTPQEFAQRFQADYATYAKVVKEARIPPLD